MKTLVIHPTDVTTDFLSTIYEGRGWTVLRDITSKSQLKESIKEHDRIVMLGHGSEYGLMRPDYSYVIDSRWVYLLREKECVYIWCNADEFVTKYKLKGFFTGMIISDYMEANLFSVHESGNDIDESNRLFAEAIKQAIDSPNPVETAKSIYQGDSGVIYFNRNNIYKN